MTDQPSFVVLGTGADFTFNVLHTLAQQQVLPKAYIDSHRVPAMHKADLVGIEIDIKPAPNRVEKLCQLHSVPFHSQFNIHVPDFIHRLDVEFILVACWPSLLPTSLIDSARRAALNLHPSLLPKYRGIDPIGAQLAQQDYDFGISLHVLNDQFDAGDIVLKKNINLQSIAQRDEIEYAAACAGAELFIQAINAYQHPGWSLHKQ